MNLPLLQKRCCLIGHANYAIGSAASTGSQPGATCIGREWDDSKRVGGSNDFLTL